MNVKEKVFEMSVKRKCPMLMRIVQSVIFPNGILWDI